MNHEQFNAFCQTFPAVTHVVQWGNSNVWKIGGKVFAIGSQNKSGEPAFTFKTSEQNFYFLCEVDGYIPAPYLASRGMKWIQQTDTRGHLDEELTYSVGESFRIVSGSLSKRLQKELGLTE